MADRYTRLVKSDKSLYCEGSPVLVEATALLKDNVERGVVAQIKFKNVSVRKIKALSVRLTCFDVAGEQLCVKNYQYLDLEVSRGRSFGSRSAVPLPNATTRSFDCVCTQVVYDDGALWEWDEETPWEAVPEQRPLSDLLNEGLSEQYRIDTTPQSAFEVSDHKDLWFCACGAVNCVSEPICFNCGMDKQALRDLLVPDDLAQRKQAREEAEAARKAQVERERKEKIDTFKSSKRGKAAIAGAAICLVLAVVAVVGFAVFGEKEMKLDDVSSVLAADSASELRAKYSDVKTDSDGDLVIKGRCGEVVGTYIVTMDDGKPDNVVFRQAVSGPSKKVREALEASFGDSDRYDTRWGYYEWNDSSTDLRVKYYPGEEIYFYPD